MNKSEIVQAILEKLREEFDSRRSISMQTRAAGNDAENKAEDKYDTRSTEENYLADGLARQALAATKAAAPYEKLPLFDFEPEDAVDLGALIELALPHSKEWFFLGPSAGGLEIELEGKAITVITPESPLGSQLMGQKAGFSTQKPKATILAIR